MPEEEVSVRIGNRRKKEVQKYSGAANRKMQVKEIKDIISMQASHVSTGKTIIFSEDLSRAIYCPSREFQAAMVLMRDAKTEAIH